MRRLIALALVIGCGGASTTPAKSRPAPTEADACERKCTVYEDCRISPPNCSAACAAEQKVLRDGVQAALVTCLERELAGCEHRPMNERREINSICFAAVLEVYSKDSHINDDIARAVCARNAKCAADPDPTCEARIRENHKNSPENRVLSLMRPALLTKMATCIAAASCDEADPSERCLREGS